VNIYLVSTNSVGTVCICDDCGPEGLEP